MIVEEAIVTGSSEPLVGMVRFPVADQQALGGP
jgi:hypothetical protein